MHPMEVAPATAEQARHLTDRIKVAVDGTWLLIQESYVTRCWSALGYASWDDYCTREFGSSRLRLPREERQEVVASLREIGMSMRAIGSATGSSAATVYRELQAGVSDETPESRFVGWADNAYRANGFDSEDLGEQEHAAAADSARTVTGVDGKTYARSSGKPQQRPALPSQFQSVAADLTRLMHRLERLQNDDRYRVNRDVIAATCVPEVRRAVDVLRGLLSDLGHDNGDPH